MEKDMIALLEEYKKQSPVKYEAKLAAGQFDKYLKKAKKEEPKEEKVVEEKKTKK